MVGSSSSVGLANEDGGDLDDAMFGLANNLYGSQMVSIADLIARLDPTYEEKSEASHALLSLLAIQTERSDAFTEPEMRELRPDWDAMTARVVPHLRSIAGPDTDNPRLAELVGELSLRSERFRTLWAREDVKHKATGTSLFNHPQVGPLELNYEMLLIPDSGMQALVTYHAQPGSESEEHLRLLASISTPGAAPAPSPPGPVRSGHLHGRRT